MQGNPTRHIALVILNKQFATLSNISFNLKSAFILTIYAISFLIDKMQKKLDLISMK